MRQVQSTSRQKQNKEKRTKLWSEQGENMQKFSPKRRRWQRQGEVGGAIKMQTQVANPENGVSWGSLDAPCWKMIPSQSSTALQAGTSPSPGPLATCHLPQLVLVAHPACCCLLQYAIKGRAVTTVNASETLKGKWYWRPPIPQRCHLRSTEKGANALETKGNSAED